MLVRVIHSYSSSSLSGGCVSDPELTPGCPKVKQQRLTPALRNFRCSGKDNKQVNKYLYIVIEL